MLQQFHHIVEILFRSPVRDGIEFHCREIRKGNKPMATYPVDGRYFRIGMTEQIHFHASRIKAEGVFGNGENGCRFQSQCLKQLLGLKFRGREIIQIDGQAVTEAQGQRSAASQGKLLKRFVAIELPQKLDYRLRDGIEAEHRKADFGSWKQAQQKARVFGESERSPVASSARRGFPYSETRICQSAQRPYSRTRCVSHEACLAGSISSRFTSQKRWPERAFIFRKGNENAGDVVPRSDVSPCRLLACPRETVL